MKKRLIALILCVVMLLSVLPLASAETGTITSIRISGVPAPIDGAAIPYDSSTLTAADPQLYKAYYWSMSWRVSDGYYMPDTSPTFDAGELYTLTLLIVPQNGATGLDETTAATLPVFIGGQKAKYAPDCKPSLDAEPGKEVFAYDIDLRCAWTNEIKIVDVNGFTLPAAGAKPCSAEALSVPEDAPYWITDVRWFKYPGAPADKNETTMADGEVFENGKWYYILVTFEPKEGYSFAGKEESVWRINGQSVLIDETASNSSSTGAHIFSIDIMAQPRHVDAIYLDGVADPFFVGDPAYTAFENVTVPVGAGYHLVTTETNATVSKDSNNAYLHDADPFDAEETYKITLRVKEEEGWTIDESTVWYINGSMDLVLGANKSGSDDYWYVRTVSIAPVAKKWIETVRVFGIEAPAAGRTAGENLEGVYVPDGPYSLIDCYWFNESTSEHCTGDKVFQEGINYSLCCVVSAYPGYLIDDSTAFELNGGDFPVDISGPVPGGAYYVWTEPMAARTVVSIYWYLNADDESPVTGAEIYQGEVFGAPAVPAKEGYIFGGWFTDKECTVPYDETAPIMEDTNLYPLWLANVTAFDAAIAAPEIGAAPSSAVTLSVTPSDANIFVDDVCWWYWDEETATWYVFNGAAFEECGYYGVGVFVNTGDRTVMDKEVVGTVNGRPTEKDAPTYKSDTRAYVLYRFDPLPCLHKERELRDVKAATCTESGYTGDTVCTKCGAELEKGMEIPALGHDFKDGVCTRCGAKDTEKPCDGGKDCPSKNFKDVNYGDWYHEAVDFAVSRGLFNGMSATTFEPNTAMSRAMLVTVLWRYEGSPKEGANSFTDVPAGQWYTDAVAWASTNGIVGGVGNGRFDPNGNITREQLAAILYRYSESKKYDVSKRDDFAGFPDKDKVSEWAKDAYGWAVGEGLITGNDGKLDPQGNATRAQVATILMRFIKGIAKK